MQRTGVKIVGYVIDKYEICDNGTMKRLDPLIVENALATSAIDVRVKYDTRYSYSIRTIALMTLPAIDSESGEIATIKILVSSRPSGKVDVNVVDETAPPPASDINFTWNYETKRLMIHWTFPPNSQRDVKKFQVFRRSSINHPFELLKEYDFDDSIVRARQRETADTRLVEYLNPESPCTFYVDDDFDKDAKFIYTVCCVDAHGLSSNYGAQYELGFDSVKNKLTKRLVSHSGAPKPYPNLYLEGSGFVDSAHVHGVHSKRMKLYFSPQYYRIEDDHGRTISPFVTKQMNGKYKIQFINVDNQRMDTVTVTINDQTTPPASSLQFPTLLNGKRM
jgi:hypothetical protein